MTAIKNIFSYYLNKAKKAIESKNTIEFLRDAGDKIQYRCLECNTELSVFKNYGILRIVCKCGNAADVYTGEDKHSIKSSSTKLKSNTNGVGDVNRSIIRYELFKKHVDADLMFLYETVSNKNGIVEQIKLKQLLKLTKGVDVRSGYALVVDKLKSHCNMDCVPINIIYVPLKDKPALSNVKNTTHIMGTTYYLNIGSQPFYTIYLNPKFIEDFKKSVSTLAHEIMHVYSNHNRIKFVSPDNDRGDVEYSEQMTDLLAIVMGMGELMCSSSNVDNVSVGGYLSEKMVHEAYEIWEDNFLSGRNKVKTLITCH